MVQGRGVVREVRKAFSVIFRHPQGRIRTVKSQGRAVSKPGNLVLLLRERRGGCISGEAAFRRA